jgi:hypothetical protein
MRNALEKVKALAQFDQIAFFRPRGCEVDNAGETQYFSTHEQD